MIQNKNNTVAVVSHDAGGAEIVSSYLKNQAVDCVYALEGPAKAIFERKLGHIENVSLADAVGRADRILCGSSWQSDLEFNAIKRARMLGKHSIVFLDHWVNYRERFVRSGEIRLPDEIWVGDAEAHAMAKDIFRGVPIHLVENPYFQDVLQELAVIPARRRTKPGMISVLYVCDPVREHALRRFGDERYWGYTEEEALRYFLSNVAALGKRIERIAIRPHPSEPAGKYKWVEKEFQLPVTDGGSRTLLQEIADSDVVVGSASMAMVIGLLAGKRVISCIPPGGRECVLPQLEIESLQNILSGNGSIAESME